MGKVILGFIGSNSNMAFAIGFLSLFAVKYIMYFAEF